MLTTPTHPNADLAATPDSRAPRVAGADRDRAAGQPPDPELTVRECVSLYAGYYSAPRDPDETMAQVALEDGGIETGRGLIE
jgi:hypothetical protein